MRQNHGVHPELQVQERKIHWKSASSETPVTISGVTSER